MCKKYVAFLDLVGTKNVALISNEAYSELIHGFVNTLNQMEREYPNVKVKYFSDSLFLSCKDRSVFKYLRNLRVLLLRKDCFFAGAIMEGDDGVDIISKENLSGIKFTNANIVNVYAMQSRFKGIGVYVKEDIVSSKSDDMFVKSLYIASDQDNPYYAEYWDISFALPNIESYIEFLKTSLAYHIKVSVLTPRAAKYYFTLSVTIINSMFQCDNFTAKHSEVIGKLFFERKSEEMLSDPEILDVFAVFLDKYYKFLKKRGNGNDIFEYLNNFHKSKLFALFIKKLVKYPSMVLSDEVKKVIIDSVYSE